MRADLRSQASSGLLSSSYGMIDLIELGETLFAHGGGMEIIFNADDFGASIEVNQAIEISFQQGFLTSASLMINGEACEDALTRIPRMPGLSIGLHLVLTEGRPALPAAEIPHLVNRNGRFYADPALAGLRYFFIPACHRELEQEIRAQFERFSAAGLIPAHLNGHHNIHVHPVVLPILLPLLREFGVAGMRIPRDDLPVSLRYSRRKIGTKAVTALVFSLLSCWVTRQLKSWPVKTTQRVYGNLQSGQMSETYLLRLLREVDQPAIEVYFHPSTARTAVPSGANRGDLKALTSPKIQSLITERHFHLCSYTTLPESMGKVR